MKTKSEFWSRRILKMIKEYSMANLINQCMCLKIIPIHIVILDKYYNNVKNKIQ